MRYILLITSHTLLWIYYIPAPLLMAQQVDTIQISSPVADPGDYFIQQQKRNKLEQQLKEQPESLNLIPELPNVTSPSATENELCFTVEKIHIHHATLFTTSTLEELVAPYLGCIGQQHIVAILQTLSHHYIEAGYITSRASLMADQNIKQSKQLHINIIEGRVEDIKLNDNSLGDRLRLMTAFPNIKDNSLNVQSLEQAIYQLNRLPSEHISMTLWPGEEIGGTKVILTDTRKDAEKDGTRFSLHYDNFGQETTGKKRLRLSLETDNLLSVNDQWNTHLITSRDTNAVTISSTIPYGYWTASLSCSYSEFLSVIDRTAEMFGTTWNHNAELSRVVHKSKASEITLNTSLNHKETRRILNDISLQSQPITVLRLGASYTARTPLHSWYIDGTYSHGVRALGALKDADTLSSDTPKAQFQKLDGGVTYIHMLEGGYLQSSLRGQYAFDTLYGSEQIHLGDNATIRGFVNSPLSGDTGVYNRNEWHMRLPPSINTLITSIKDASIAPYILADAGATKLAFADDIDALVGGGMGVRWHYKRLAGEAIFALPLYAASHIKQTGLELYLTMNIKLDEWW